MKLKYKLRPGERVFGHHTADEPPTGAVPPWGGISSAAENDPRAIGVKKILAESKSWSAIEEYLGQYRIVVGKEISGRPIAMVVCKDGRTYDIELLDNGSTEEEPVESIAERLADEVQKAKAYPAMSRVERFLRYGRKGIE